MSRIEHEVDRAARIPARRQARPTLARVAILAAVLAGMLAALVTATAAQPAARTLEHQGVARHVIVVNAEAGGPRPTLIVLHGRRDADAPNRSSPFLDALARKEGFTVAYPAGVDGVWNWPTRTDTPQTPLSKAGGEITDDLGFLTRLMDLLIAERIADPRRIYLSGASMGGFMTFALACAVPDRIAAAASMIAAMTDRLAEQCKPGRAVPMMLLNGTLDRLVPYEGVKTPAGTIFSVRATLDFWSRAHGCTGIGEVRLPGPAGASDENVPITVQRIDVPGCRVAGTLRAYVVVGGGHTLPSRAQQTPQNRERFGPRGSNFETSEEVWTFLSRFSR